MKKIDIIIGQKGTESFAVKYQKKNLNLIKRLLLFFLNSIGYVMSFLPSLIKKYLAMISIYFTFNDTLSRWNYLMMEKVFSNAKKPVILCKKNFKVFDSRLNFPMKLDLSADPQRAYYFQNYGQDLLKIMKLTLDRNSIFIDVGANIGYFSMLASSIIKEGRIIAFEPSSLNYKVLAENAKGSVIRPFKIALSNKNGYSRLFVGKKSSGWYSLTGTGRYEKIKISRFDELKLRLQRIDLIKIDVERHELEVLEGMKKSLIKYSPKVVCEVDDTTKEKIVRFMAKIGYCGDRFEGTNTYDIFFEKKKNLQE